MQIIHDLSKSTVPMQDITDLITRKNTNYFTHYFNKGTVRFEYLVKDNTEYATLTSGTERLHSPSTLTFDAVSQIIHDHSVSVKASIALEAQDRFEASQPLDYLPDYLAKKGFTLGDVLDSGALFKTAVPGRFRVFTYSALNQEKSGNVKNITGYQEIDSHEKNTLAGAAIRGSFLVLSKPTGASLERIDVLEGCANALAWTKALTQDLKERTLVVGAIYANNIPAVVEELLEYKVPIRVIPDHDPHNNLNPTQRANTGLAYAQAAAQLSTLVTVSNIFTKSKDALDTADCILSPKWWPIVVKEANKGATRIVAQAAGVAASSGPTEKELASIVFEQGNLSDFIRVGTKEEIFKWSDTHWEPVFNVQFEADLKAACAGVLPSTAKNKDVTSLFSTVWNRIKPVSAEEGFRLYSADLNMTNFLDCTVSLETDSEGKSVLVARDGVREDYFGRVKPFYFKNPERNWEGKPVNGMFDKFMEAREKEGNARTLKQLMGLALVPQKEAIVICEGPSNYGKSTFAALLMELLGEKLVCDSDPCDWHQPFMMEPMIGKEANIVLELGNNRKLDANTIKKIRDKKPASINRKGQTVIKAIIPLFQLYCCNIAPTISDGNSGALDNRITLIRFSERIEESVFGMDNLASFMWKHDSGSVIRAAFEGLQDLVACGFKLVAPEYSAEAVQEWQDESDSVALFLDQAARGEVIGLTYSKDSDDSILGRDLYPIYDKWCKDSGVSGKFKNTTFYKKLTQKKVKFEVESRTPMRRFFGFKTDVENYPF